MCEKGTTRNTRCDEDERVASVEPGSVAVDRGDSGDRMVRRNREQMDPGRLASERVGRKRAAAAP